MQRYYLSAFVHTFWHLIWIYVGYLTADDFLALVICPLKLNPIHRTNLFCVYFPQLLRTLAANQVRTRLFTTDCLQTFIGQHLQNQTQTLNSEDFAHLSPSEIVPRLSNQGNYIASESSFNRVLKSASWS